MTGERRNSPARRWLAVACALLLTACVSPSDDPQEPGMNHAEAEQRILTFIDEALTDAAPGRRPVPGPSDGSEEECSDGLRSDGTVGRTYQRVIRDVDERLADTAERRFAAFLQRKGLAVQRDDSIPGLVDLRVSDDGFLFLLSVNRNNKTLLAGGNTPCLPAT